MNFLKNRIPAIFKGILFLLLLLFSSEAHSQCTSCPAIDLACTGGDEGTISMFLDITSYGVNDACPECCTSPTCRKVMYEVRLGVNSSSVPGSTGSCFRLNYSELMVQAGISVQEGWLTSLNKEVCPGPALAGFSTGGAYTLDADIDTDITTLKIGDASNPAGDVPTLCFTQEQVPAGGYQYVSEVLFVMTADFYPGEDNMGQGAWQVAIEYTNITPGEKCNGISGQQGDSSTPFDAPASVNTNVELSLGTPDCDDDNSRFPVTVTSGTGETGFLDFSLLVGTDPTTIMGEPTISNVYVAPEVYHVVPLPGNAGYNILISYDNITIPSGTTTLFQLDVTPISFTAGTNVNVQLSAGRIDCDAPVVDVVKAECKTDPVADICDNDYYLITHPDTYLPSGSDCSTLAAFIELGGPANFTGEMDIRIDFDLDPGVSISNATFTGTGTIGYTANSVTLTGTSVVWGLSDFIEITFSGTTGCVRDAIARKTLMKPTGGSTFCSLLNFPFDFPACAGGELTGEIKTEGGCFVQNVAVNKLPQSDPGSCVFSLSPTNTDCDEYSCCLCPNVQEWIIRPEKNDDLYEVDPLSSEDLLVIRDHILGITPLPSPYQMIAADADLSGSITAFDIVEFRKLLLGIYNNSGNPWPSGNAPSWRFVPESYTFPNPSNPFSSTFPEEIQSVIPIIGADFVAIKTGSMFHDNMHDPDDICSTSGCDPYPRPATMDDYQVKIAAPKVKSGQLVTIPISAAHAAPLVAWQMGIRFDVTRLDFVSATPGDLSDISADNFGLTDVQEGVIKSAWMGQLNNSEDHVNPNDVLFYLTFRAKGELLNTDHLLDLDTDILACNGWMADYTKFPLKQVTTDGVGIRSDDNAVASFYAGCRPNPSKSDFVIDLSVNNPTSIVITFYDALGKSVCQKTMDVTTGMQIIPINESIQWPAGIYRWSIRSADSLSANGQFVKQ